MKAELGENSLLVLQKRELIYSSLWVERDFTDATVNCRGKSWEVHRGVLCASSRFFKGAFSNGMTVGASGPPLKHQTDTDIGNAYQDGESR